MNIYTTIDCVKLTAFDKLLLSCIKGVCYDYNHSIKNHVLHNKDFDVVNITVYQSENFTVFKLENTAKGVFDDVKKLAEPFAHGFKFQGSWNEGKNLTTIMLQRFEVEKKNVVLNYYQAIGITAE